MIIKPEPSNNTLMLTSENVYHRRSYLMGTKAKALCLASSVGARVPTFRILSSEAFFLMLRHNRLGIGHLNQPRNRTKKLAEIRERIIHSDIPPALEDKIRGFLDLVEARSFVVRLSCYSPVELAHSPHFFRLNLKKTSSVISAVKRCWAACFSELFFHPDLFDSQSVNKRGPAVIIQHMINGSVSGVFYSQSPDPGEENAAMLAWCKGLGVSVKDAVDGSLCVEKIKDGSTIEKRDGIQTSYYAAAANGGTQILKIENPEDSVPVLREELKQEIISLGNRLNFLGKPVMISWTISEGNVFLLGQTFCRKSPHEEESVSSLYRGEKIWSDRFTSSLFPTPLSPLSCSIWHHVLEKNWGKKALSFIKVRENKERPLFRTINSRLYMDEFCLERIESIKLSRFLLISTMRNITGLAPNFSYRRFRKKLTKFLIQGNKTSIKNKTSAELIGRVKKARVLLGRFSYIYFFTLIKSILLRGVLEKLLKVFFGGKHKRVMLVLIGKDGGIHASVRENIENISRMLWSSEKFQDFLHSHKKRTFQEILREDSMGMPFLRACCRFNQKFGWLTESTDISMLPLEERSSHLFDLCALFQRQKDAVKFQNTLLKRAEVRRERYVKIVNARFSRRVPGAGKVFFIFLRHVKKSMEIVEDGTVFIQKLLAGKRRIFLELGERLVDEGRIADKKDIFFLTWENVEKAFKTKDSLKKNIAAKKKIFAADKLKYHASRYLEHGQRLTPLLQEDRRLIYQGQGTSHGCSVAPLAVRTPGQPLGDVSGKILLVTALNREWDFNIVGAAGIITESGGISGHAAYIARQHAIPAVSGIPGLLLNMQDGDIVYLNAFDGIVELLHPASFLDNKNE